MQILDLFSKRQKSVANTPIQPQRLPDQFRGQLLHILRGLFGRSCEFGGACNEAYESIHAALCYEYGVLHLTPGVEDPYNYEKAVHKFVLSAPVDRVLDVIEVSIRHARSLQNLAYQHEARPTINLREATSQLNVRFLENNIGYQLNGYTIVCVESQLLHSEVVEPALNLLSEKRLSGANEEFLRAHRHYRHSNFEESITDCLKSLESTLKIICEGRAWTVPPNPTAKALLDVIFEQRLVPEYLLSQFNSLRTTLESGVPTVRNKSAAHGQGSSRRQVPDYLAAYVLHLTASAIVFLVESDKAKI